MHLNDGHYDIEVTPENTGIFEFDQEMMNCMCVRALGEVVILSESFTPGYYLLKLLAMQEGVEVIDNIEFNPKRPTHEMMLRAISSRMNETLEKIANGTLA
jgi:hypothetical protein